MASQVALNTNLSNCFQFYDFEKEMMPLQKGCYGEDLAQSFEAGKIIVFDNLKISNISFFLNQPGKWFPDWIPPIFGRKIRKEISADHVLRQLYDSAEEIEQFKNHAAGFEDSWAELAQTLFPKYDWDYKEFSYRFNHMDLGNLHLDVPDKAYEGQQFRWFINLDVRPRILAIGPTIFELAELFWEKLKMEDIQNLPVHQFIGKLREISLDKTIYKERELPRHYLTLDPGSLWLAHSSYVSHGLVYGRKTACFEGHVRPSSLLNPTRHFNSMIRALQKYGPCSETDLQRYVNLDALNQEPLYVQS